jgi:hypothetical protein
MHISWIKCPEFIRKKRKRTCLYYNYIYLFILLFLCFFFLLLVFYAFQPICDGSGENNFHILFENKFNINLDLKIDDSDDNDSNGNDSDIVNTYSNEDKKNNEDNENLLKLRFNSFNKNIEFLRYDEGYNCVLLLPKIGIGINKLFYIFFFYFYFIVLEKF